MKNKIASVLFGVFVASSLSACVVVAKDAPPPARPKPAKAKPNPPPAEATQDQGKGAEGKPPSLKSGNPEAFYIWHDTAGWHLRTTTAKKEHRFYGRVQAKDGEIKSVKSFSAEHNDDVILEGPEVKFDLTTAGGEDGFDFTTPDGVCVGFHLFIDGQPATKDKIIIGAGEVKPGNHIKICP